MPMVSTLVLASHDNSYTTWSSHVMPWLIVGVLLILAILIGYANWQNSRPFRVESSTTLSQEQALDQLQATFARDGWALGYRDASSLIMHADKGASFGSTAAIGCISVWLALLHLLSSRSQITVEIASTETGAGTTLITNGTKSGDGVLRYVTSKLHDLPKVS